jgi:F-type H+-transporting ATPase subunit b
MEFLHDAEFWVLVAAVVFVAALGHKAFRATTGGLDARAARIRAELDEARRLREEAERLLAEYRTKQREAAAEAGAIVAHAASEAERIAAQAGHDLEAALERRRRMAEDRIAQAEARALAEVRGEAIDVAIAAAREHIAAQMDGRRGTALIDDAIAALPQRLR